MVAVHFLPVRSSRCTGVPTGRVSLCLVTSWKVGSGIHSVVAVRKDRSAGVAANNKQAPQNTHTMAYKYTFIHKHTHAVKEGAGKTGSGQILCCFSLNITPSAEFTGSPPASICI